MPNVIDARFEVAQSRLENLDLIVDWDEATYEVPEEYYVASIVPAGGTEVLQGSTVLLVLRPPTPSGITSNPATHPDTPGTVVYEIGGTATNANISWAGVDYSPNQQEDVPLPWTTIIEFGEEPITASLWARNSGWGIITCSIRVAGVIVSSEEATGNLATVQCSPDR